MARRRWLSVAIVLSTACGRVGVEPAADAGAPNRDARPHDGDDDAPDADDGCVDATAACHARRFRRVVVGLTQSCAITGDDRLFCWGQRWGTATVPHGLAPRAEPTEIALAGGVTDVAVGATMACAVTRDGGAYCWGANDWGQLGTGSSLASTTPQAVSLPRPARAIGAGFQHACAILDDGKLRCWGRNDTGELADGTKLSRSTPVAPAGLAGRELVEVGGGVGHTCARTSDDRVLCWGASVHGECGGVVSDHTIAPTEVALPTDAALAGLSVGMTTTCVWTHDGQAVCWGQNQSGQLGPAPDPAVPTVHAELGAVGSVGVGAAHVCGARTDGSVVCLGYGAHGQLNQAALANSSAAVPIAAVRDVVAVSAGWHHGCALGSDGSVQCWGRDSYGALGDGAPASARRPVRADTGLARPAEGAAALNATCWLDGGGTAACAGWGVTWQLGDGTQVTRAHGEPVAAPPVPFAALAGGELLFAGLGTDRRVYVWGLGAEGQLGLGTSISSPTPALVPGPTNVDHLAAGRRHTCAASTALGRTWCWGANDRGQRGSPVVAPVGTPVDVLGLPATHVRALAAGADHTCAAVDPGEVWCWGSNTAGQLGSEGPDTTGPRLVPGLARVSRVAAGGQHTCAATETDEVYCWGANALGQLGTTDVYSTATPTRVEGVAARVVVAGEAHTCAIPAGIEGQLRCWGDNQLGQLGDGTYTSSAAPVGVRGILAPAVRSLTAGPTHNCVTTTAGAASCWGDGWYGQLGDGSSVVVGEATRLTPPVPSP